MGKILSALGTIFGVFVDFIVGILCIIALAAIAMCLFPITLGLAVFMIIYGIGKIFGKFKEFEHGETKEKDTPSTEQKEEVFYDVE